MVDCGWQTIERRQWVKKVQARGQFALPERSTINIDELQLLSFTLIVMSSWVDELTFDDLGVATNVIQFGKKETTAIEFLQKLPPALERE